MREIIGSNLAQRHVKTYEELEGRVRALRTLGYRIGLTSGTWDLWHIGHARYIERLKERVDIVIVGVDSDEKTRRRKGPHRPVVPEDERLEILCHARHVDLVFVKGADDPHGRLVQTIRPDVLLMVNETYEGREEELAGLQEFCSEILIVEPQAITSTTAKIRLLLVEHLKGVLDKLDEARSIITNLIKEER